MEAFNVLVDQTETCSFHIPGLDTFLVYEGLVLPMGVNGVWSMIRVHLFLKQVPTWHLTHYASSILGARDIGGRSFKIKCVAFSSDKKCYEEQSSRLAKVTR